MKHLLIYVITAVLIFSFINFFVLSNGNTATSLLPSSLTLAMMSASPDTLAAPRLMSAKAGAIFNTLDNRGAIACKRALTQALDGEYDLRISEVVGNEGIQKETFDKMVEKEYKLIFLELFAGSPIGYFMDTANAAGITLILMGDPPTGEQMSHAGESVYYLGYGQDSPVQKLGEVLATLRQENGDAAGAKAQEQLAYSIISKENWETNGYLEEIEGSLEAAGVTAKLVQSSVAGDMNAKVEKSAYQMVAKGSEIILCNEAAVAKRLSTYFSDASKFRKKPDTKIVLLSMDEDARALVETGDVAVAMGYDGAALGQKAAQLAQLVLGGEKPSGQALGLGAESGNRFYLKPTCLFAGT